jgi:rhamnose utilization protein RhaD (predicted bifunctional aldolase and dehydrogenase)
VQNLLTTITALSHEFGTTDYVRGGGGNTSVKDETTLWVKPSGTTLGGLTPETFVALDRAKINELYAIETPAEPHAREALVKDRMAAAVLPDSSGRASVEAPLHETLSARYVVHTHPARVNGMTCAKNGKATAERLFPEALWLDFIDPGYTLCMRVRQEILDYKERHGLEPSIIFLKSHGVFVSGDTPEAIREIYHRILTTLTREYERAGVSLSCDMDAAEVSANDLARIHTAFADDTLAVRSSAAFAVPAGPISPDHIVYAKSYPLRGEPTTETVAAYREQYGYNPRILVWDQQVHGVDTTDKKAALALEMAQDGCYVEQLSQAFGGIEYMTDRARAFIENWEVESYRSQQI